MGLATLEGTKLTYLDSSFNSKGGTSGTSTARCYIRIPSKIQGTAITDTMIKLYTLPDVSDTKTASYSNESVVGRSSPIKTYSHSDDRQISIQLHFVTDCEDRVWENLKYLRMLQSAVYPQYDTTDVPYYPPPVCKIVIGQLLGKCPLCAVLKSYAVRYPTDVAWDEITFLPQKFDVDTSWEVVYRPTNLPGQEKILRDVTAMGQAGGGQYYSELSGSQFSTNCSSSEGSVLSALGSAVQSTLNTMANSRVMTAAQRQAALDSVNAMKRNLSNFARSFQR